MSKLILTFVMVLSAASISLAECPFKNMSANARVGLFDQATNFALLKTYNTMDIQNVANPVRRQK